MIRVLIGAAVLLLLVPAAQADLISGGDFESGGPPGLVKIGNSNLFTSAGSGALTPYGGSLFLAASTSGSSVITAGTGPAAFFSGDVSGNGQAVTQYSGISFPLVTTFESDVTLMMNFFSSEVGGGVSDLFAIYVDDGKGGGPVLIDGFAFVPGTGVTSPFGEFSTSDFDGTSFADPILGSFSGGQTGWIPITEHLLTGTYTVYILVADTADSIVDSGFAVDDITVVFAPEPGTWLLFGLGAVGLAGYRRFRRKPKAA